MNQTETLAYEWLIAQGYSQEQIAFQRRRSPDFVTADGKGWEVKLVRENSIIFSTSQLLSLRDHSHSTVLIFRTGEAAPIGQFPINTVEVPGYWQHFRLGLVDYKNLPEGETIVTVRQFNSEVWRLFRIRALELRRGVGDLLTEIVLDWLED